MDDAGRWTTFALPEEVRDLICAPLTRCEAARACCVSRAWNAALSAPRFWTALDFTDVASFGRPVEDAACKADRLPLTPAVVLGACVKAGRVLQGSPLDVTLPWRHYEEVAGSHIALRRVASPHLVSFLRSRSVRRFS